MPPQLRRITIPLVIRTLAMMVVLTMFVPGRSPEAPEQAEQAAPAEAGADADAQPGETDGEQPPALADGEDGGAAPTPAAGDPAMLTGLRAVVPPDVQDDP